MTVTAPAQYERPKTIAPTGLRRYQATCVIAVLAASVPYLLVAWNLRSGSIDLLRVRGDSSLYDEQARAIMHGHLWLSSNLGGEAFVSNGRYYTYLGIFPSLLRIPIFIFTNSFDGRLVSLSTLVAWIVTAVSCSLLFWRLRIFLRGNPPLGWLEATSYGLLLASILVGSVLVFLAAFPNSLDEDEAWSVALACASLFALLGVIERPSWKRITLCGALVLLTNLNRSTTGYAAILATLLVAVWFGLGRAGPLQRQRAVPIAVAGVIPLVVGCAINLAKFGVPFGIPFSSQLVYKWFGLRNINGGHYFSFHWLPDTLKEYVYPWNFRFTSVFPYITRPAIGMHLFGGDQTANVLLSMPLLFSFGLWGVITTFMPGRSIQFRALRILLIAAAATAAPLMIYGWIYERFVSDFMPLLILAGMVGMVDVWRRADDTRATNVASVVLGIAIVLALFGFWANMGYAWGG